MWLLSSVLLVKVEGQTGQARRDSELYSSLWMDKALDWLNPLPHVGHLCGFSPVCVLICVASPDDELNAF